MEDSVKGILVTSTIILIFMMSIFGFITKFPGEQGVILEEVENDTYLVIENMNVNPTTTLSTINNQTDEGFNQWNIEVGFMGSNTQKGSRGGMLNQIGLIFTSLKSMADNLFGENSPVYIVLAILTTLSIGYFIYVFIKFLRTGN